MGVIEHALDEMPAAHKTLWLKGKLTVKLAASRYFVAGRPMSEILAVIADPGTLIAEVVRRFFGAQVVQAGGGDDPFVGLLVGDAMDRLLLNFPDTAARMRSVPKHALLLITAPIGSRPGASMVFVTDRRRTA